MIVFCGFSEQYGSGIIFSKSVKFVLVQCDDESLEPQDRSDSEYKMKCRVLIIDITIEYCVWCKEPKDYSEEKIQENI